MGTTTPQVPLDVVGSIRGGSETVAANYSLSLASGAVNRTNFARYSGADGIGEIRHQGAGSFQTVLEGASNYIVSINGAERFRIEPTGGAFRINSNYGTSGQVLISQGATTAPIWGSPFSWTYGASQNTTTGTQFDFTGIPAGLNDVVLDLTDVSLSGTDNLLVQLGTSGGIVTTGYGGSASVVAAASANSDNYTNGAGIRVGVAAATSSGRVRMERLSGNIWQISHIITFKATANGNAVGCSIVDLGAELTQIRLTRTGANTFDGGSARHGWR